MGAREDAAAVRQAEQSGNQPPAWDRYADFIQKRPVMASGLTISAENPVATARPQDVGALDLSDTFDIPFVPEPSRDYAPEVTPEEAALDERGFRVEDLSPEEREARAIKHAGPGLTQTLKNVAVAPGGLLYGALRGPGKFIARKAAMAEAIKQEMGEVRKNPLLQELRIYLKRKGRSDFAIDRLFLQDAEWQWTMNPDAPQLYKELEFPEIHYKKGKTPWYNPLGTEINEGLENSPLYKAAPKFFKHVEGNPDMVAYRERLGKIAEHQRLSAYPDKSGVLDGFTHFKSAVDKMRARDASWVEGFVEDAAEMREGTFALLGGLLGQTIEASKESDAGKTETERHFAQEADKGDAFTSGLVGSILAITDDPDRLRRKPMILLAVVGGMAFRLVKAKASIPAPVRRQIAKLRANDSAFDRVMNRAEALVKEAGDVEVGGQVRSKPVTEIGIDPVISPEGHIPGSYRPRTARDVGKRFVSGTLHWSLLGAPDLGILNPSLGYFHGQALARIPWYKGLAKTLTTYTRRGAKYSEKDAPTEAEGHRAARRQAATVREGRETIGEVQRDVANTAPRKDLSPYDPDVRHTEATQTGAAQQGVSSRVEGYRDPSFRMEERSPSDTFTGAKDLPPEHPIESRPAEAVVNPVTRAIADAERGIADVDGTVRINRTWKETVDPHEQMRLDAEKHFRINRPWEETGVDSGKPAAPVTEPVVEARPPVVEPQPLDTGATSIRIGPEQYIEVVTPEAFVRQEKSALADAARETGVEMMESLEQGLREERAVASANQAKARGELAGLDPRVVTEARKRLESEASIEPNPYHEQAIAALERATAEVAQYFEATTKPRKKVDVEDPSAVEIAEEGSAYNDPMSLTGETADLLYSGGTGGTISAMKEIISARARDLALEKITEAQGSPKYKAAVQALERELGVGETRSAMARSKDGYGGLTPEGKVIAGTPLADVMRGKGTPRGLEGDWVPKERGYPGWPKEPGKAKYGPIEHFDPPSKASDPSHRAGSSVTDGSTYLESLPVEPPTGKIWQEHIAKRKAEAEVAKIEAEAAKTKAEAAEIAYALERARVPMKDRVTPRALDPGQRRTGAKPKAPSPEPGGPSEAFLAAAADYHGTGRIRPGKKRDDAVRDWYLSVRKKRKLTLPEQLDLLMLMKDGNRKLIGTPLYELTKDVGRDRTGARKLTKAEGDAILVQAEKYIPTGLTKASPGFSGPKAEVQAMIKGEFHPEIFPKRTTAERTYIGTKEKAGSIPEEISRIEALDQPDARKLQLLRGMHKTLSDDLAAGRFGGQKTPEGKTRTGGKESAVGGHEPQRFRDKDKARRALGPDLEYLRAQNATENAAGIAQAKSKTSDLHSQSVARKRKEHAAGKLPKEGLDRAIAKAEKADVAAREAAAEFARLRDVEKGLANRGTRIISENRRKALEANEAGVVKAIEALGERILKAEDKAVRTPGTREYGLVQDARALLVGKPAKGLPPEMVKAVKFIRHATRGKKPMRVQEARQKSEMSVDLSPAEKAAMRTILDSVEKYQLDRGVGANVALGETRKATPKEKAEVAAVKPEEPRSVVAKDVTEAPKAKKKAVTYELPAEKKPAKKRRAVTKSRSRLLRTSLAKQLKKFRVEMRRLRMPGQSRMKYEAAIFDVFDSGAALIMSDGMKAALTEKGIATIESAIGKKLSETDRAAFTEAYGQELARYDNPYAGRPEVHEYSRFSLPSLEAQAVIKSIPEEFHFLGEKGAVLAKVRTMDNLATVVSEMTPRQKQGAMIDALSGLEAKYVREAQAHQMILDYETQARRMGFHPYESTAAEAAQAIVAYRLLNKGEMPTSLPSRVYERADNGSWTSKDVTPTEMAQAILQDPKGLIEAMNSRLAEAGQPALTQKQITNLLGDISAPNAPVDASSPAGKVAKALEEYTARGDIPNVGKGRVHEKDFARALEDILPEDPDAPGLLDSKGPLAAGALDLLSHEGTSRVGNTGKTKQEMRLDQVGRAYYNPEFLDAWTFADSMRRGRESRSARTLMGMKAGVTAHQGTTNVANTISHPLSAGLITGESLPSFGYRVIQTWRAFKEFKKDPKSFKDKAKGDPVLEETVVAFETIRDHTNLRAQEAVTQEMQQLRSAKQETQKKGHWTVEAWKSYDQARKDLYLLEDSTSRLAEVTREAMDLRRDLESLKVGEEARFETGKNVFINVVRTKDGFTYKDGRLLDEGSLRQAVASYSVRRVSGRIPNFQEVPRFIEMIRSAKGVTSLIPNLFSAFISFPYLVLDIPGYKKGMFAETLFQPFGEQTFTTNSPSLGWRRAVEGAAKSARVAQLLLRMQQLRHPDGDSLDNLSLFMGSPDALGGAMVRDDDANNMAVVYRTSSADAFTPSTLFAKNMLAGMSMFAHAFGYEGNKSAKYLRAMQKRGDALSLDDLVAGTALSGGFLFEPIVMAASGRHLNYAGEADIADVLSKLASPFFGGDTVNLAKTAYGAADPKGRFSSFRRIIEEEEKAREISGRPDFAFQEWTPKAKRIFLMENMFGALTNIRGRRVPIYDTTQPAGSNQANTYIKRIADRMRKSLTNSSLLGLKGRKAEDANTPEEKKAIEAREAEIEIAVTNYTTKFTEFYEQLAEYQNRYKLLDRSELYRDKNAKLFRKRLEARRKELSGESIRAAGAREKIDEKSK